MRERYGYRNDWPWPAESPPAPYARIRSPGLQIAGLPIYQQTQPWRPDHVLLSILSRSRLPNQGRWTACPDWLSRALDELEEKGDCEDALGALIEKCGRSREHIAREIRRCLNQRPVDLVNGLRMERAAQLIALHGHSLPEVIAMVGLSNRTHFHQLFFQTHHGCTPTQYRRQDNDSEISEYAKAI